MAVFEGSRLKNCRVLEDVEDKFLSFDSTHLVPDKNDFVYEFKQGDRLDIIASKVYGNAQLKYLILKANPKYNHEFEIQMGDKLIIPNPDRRDL